MLLIKMMADVVFERLLPPFGKGRLGGIFAMRTSSKNLPSPLFSKEGYFRAIKWANY